MTMTGSKAQKPIEIQRRPIVRDPVLHTHFGIGFGDALCIVQLCLHGSHVETALKTQSTVESKLNGGRWRLSTENVIYIVVAARWGPVEADGGRTEIAIDKIIAANGGRWRRWRPSGGRSRHANHNSTDKNGGLRGLEPK